MLKGKVYSSSSIYKNINDLLANRQSCPQSKDYFKLFSMPLSKKTAPKSYGKSSVFKKKCVVLNLLVF
jgi:hypothetical protein